MPKRTFWLITGAAVGAGSSLWVERRVRRTVQEAAARLQPDALVAEVGRSARQAAGVAGDRMRDAVSVGRDEMRMHEQQLWEELAARGVEVPPAEVSVEPSGRTGPVVEPPERRRRRRPTRGATVAAGGDAASGAVPMPRRRATRGRAGQAPASPATPVAGGAPSTSHLDR